MNFFEIFSKHKKVKNFQWKIIKCLWFFIENFWLFLCFEKISKNFHFFFTFFFDRSQKNYFSELKKKVDYRFDVKNWYLSIYDVFSAFWALQPLHRRGYIICLLFLFPRCHWGSSHLFRNAELSTSFSDSHGDEVSPPPCNMKAYSADVNTEEP